MCLDVLVVCVGLCECVYVCGVGLCVVYVCMCM